MNAVSASKAHVIVGCALVPCGARHEQAASAPGVDVGLAGRSG